MRWAVYWQRGNEINVSFHSDEAGARKRVRELSDEYDSVSDEFPPYWDITLLRVVGEVKLDTKLNSLELEVV